jgi:hypothetical protein
MNIGKTVDEPLMDKISNYLHMPTYKLVITVTTNDVWNKIWVNHMFLFTTIITIEPMIE